MKKFFALWMALCCFAVLLPGPAIAEEEKNLSLQQEAEEQLQKELGAFEITAHQREIAKTNEAG